MLRSKPCSPPLVFNTSGPDLACQAQPPYSTLEVQLGTIARRVNDMVLEPEDTAANHYPPPRKSASPKTRARGPSTLVRQSVRQALMNNPVPFAERVALRIVRELGMLGPKERMTSQAAEALIHHFDEPLSKEHIACIAKITRLDEATLLVATGLTGPDGATIVG
ncbi:hypothetical protein VPH35_022393 [Triticum aestivum]